MTPFRPTFGLRPDLVSKFSPRPPYGGQCILCRQRAGVPRHFIASSTRRNGGGSHDQASFRSRLRTALRDTKITWYPIPVGLGIGFLGFAQLYRIQQREKLRQEEDHERDQSTGGQGEGNGGRPKKRKRIRPSGPWYVGPEDKTSQLPDIQLIAWCIGRFRSCPRYL